jgi:hypothetical protein
MKYIPRTGISGLVMDEMADNPDETDDAVAARVKLLRRVVKPGMSIKDYAERFLRVGYTRYFNVENGGPLGRDLAGVIRRKVPRITTDWLYYKDTRGVHLELLQALSEAADAIERDDNAEAGP